MGIIAGAALEGAIRTEFLETYEPMYERVEEDLRDMMRLAVPSDKLREKYVYFTSAPHPKRQARGEELVLVERDHRKREQCKRRPTRLCSAAPTCHRTEEPRVG